MDMKRILQAFDGASTKPVKGASDMSKFLSIIDKNDVSVIKEDVDNNKVLNEGSNPHKVSLPVQMAMQHYQQPQEKKVKEPSLLERYFSEVNDEILEQEEEKKQLLRQYASTIAQRVLVKESKEVISEKSVSQKQARTMAAAAHDPKFAKKVGIKQSVAKEFNKADTGTKQLSQAMQKKKKVKEETIPGHAPGFTGGVGPGTQSPVAETPIALDVEKPMSSTIHSHKGANPGSIEYRIMRARAQLKDLAQQAQSDDPLVWQHISRLFPELQMNIEQVAHGLVELGKEKRKGGTRSKNIPTGLDEVVLPKIKAAKPKAIKPKTKTSSCRAGQVQTGVQNKDGKIVPKCSVK